MSMFPLLSFEQANPVLSGFGAVQQLIHQGLKNKQMQTANKYQEPGLIESLRQAKLQNAMGDINLQYAPDMADANLGLLRGQAGEANARIPLYNAQATLANLESQYLPYKTAAGFDPVTKMLAGRMFSNKLGGLSSNDGGMTVTPAGYGGGNSPAQMPVNSGGQSQIPGGMGSMQNTPMANMNMPRLPGGMSPTQGAGMLAGINGDQAPPGTADNSGGSLSDNLYNIYMKNQLATIGKNPAFGSMRSGAGGTYVDPVTNKTYQTPTSKTSTLDQQTIAAIDRVKPIIESLSKNLSPFQTARGQANLKLEQYGNYLFGMNNSLPAMYAQGQSDLQTSPEGLLKAWGLNVTNESQHAMREAVKPQFGESTQQYQDRLINALKTLSENQRQAKVRNKSGIPLDDEEPQSSHVGQNYVYNPDTGGFD